MSVDQEHRSIRLISISVISILITAVFVVFFLIYYRPPFVIDGNTVIEKTLEPAMEPGDLKEYEIDCNFIVSGKMEVSLSFNNVSDDCNLIYVSLSNQDKPLFAQEEEVPGENYTLVNFHNVMKYKEKTLTDQTDFAFGGNKFKFTLYLVNNVDKNEPDVTFSYSLTFRKVSL